MARKKQHDEGLEKKTSDRKHELQDKISEAKL